MKIIAAYNAVTKENLSQAQIEQDLPDLQKEHEEALKESPTWKWFGGILIVNGHEYQVA
jgi:hypothetical protein